MKSGKLSAALLGVAMMWLTPASWADSNFPTKPITLVIPFPSGGTSDTLGRMVADGMSKQLGQPVIVENRPGAGTVIGTDHVAKSSADGYTVLLTSPGVAINASMRQSLPYDTKRDIEHIVTIGDLPMAIFASPNSGFNSVADLLAEARKNPETISYGTAGTGSTGHLTVKLMEHLADIKLLHVPFQGSAPSVNAAAGGHVQFAVDTVFLGKPMVEAGKLKALVTFGEARSPLLPDAPTSTESGLPKLVSTAWYAIALKKGTPADVKQKLNASIVKTLSDPKTKDSLQRMGLQIVGDTPEEAEARFQNELEKMANAVRLSGESLP